MSCFDEVRTIILSRRRRQEGGGHICFDLVAYVLYKRNYELQYLKHPSSSLASPNFVLNTLPSSSSRKGGDLERICKWNSLGTVFV
jgi:hypothetical protein